MNTLNNLTILATVYSRRHTVPAVSRLRSTAWLAPSKVLATVIKLINLISLARHEAPWRLDVLGHVLPAAATIAITPLPPRSPRFLGAA
jgi:hypothetical protein